MLNVLLNKNYNMFMLFFSTYSSFTTYNVVVQDEEEEYTEDELDDGELLDIGIVQSVGDGIISFNGLQNARVGELVSVGEEEVVAMVLTIDNLFCEAVLFGNDRDVQVGATVESLGSLACCPVGPELLGRVVDPLGNPLDDVNDVIEVEEVCQVEVEAPGIVARKSVHEPLLTGIVSIDAMIPIGRGQRELIIGDRQVGKTTIAVDTILNQQGLIENELPDAVFSIYVAIGQRKSSVAYLYQLFQNLNVMDSITIINASASEAAGLQYLAPYAGATMGEYYRDRGNHALVVYDDLSKQAVAFRQMSLLLRRPPGREAYPGDVFYLHSRLLERAAKLSDEFGAGSLTALPVIETQAGDVSAYIPTNVISITDGQIFLESELFFGGVRPAVNVGLSVSRIGSAAQPKPLKLAAGSMKLALAQYREMEAFASFGSELDEVTQQIIRRGSRLVELLKQFPYNPLALYHQFILIVAGTSGILDFVDLRTTVKFREILHSAMQDKEVALTTARVFEDYSRRSPKLLLR